MVRMMGVIVAVLPDPQLQLLDAQVQLIPQRFQPGDDIPQVGGILEIELDLIQ